MVEIQFIGDVNNLSDKQKFFIVNVLEERGLKNGNINVQPVGKAGDNYGANVQRITVENNGETFKMIAKIAPKDGTMRTIVNSGILFQNEHIMYTKVLPKFTELEKAANIPEEERLRYAACYGTYMEAPNEIILLEDLEVPGFQMLDRFTSLTDENVRLVLKNFASFHSLSYALKYKETEIFERFCKGLVNFWSLMANVPEMIEWMNQIDTDAQVALDNDKYKNAVKNASVQMITLGAKFYEFDAISKYSVIQQGDSWTNNIIFRHENGCCVECCMIDYQISKQGNPAADLLYMIFNSTDYATRAMHFHDWIDYYHSQLDKNLANHGLKANYVFPRDQLDADLRRCAKVALGQAVLGAIFLVKDTEGASKLRESMNTDLANIGEQNKLSSSDSETIKKFKVRLEELVDSFIEYGYLSLVYRL